MINCGPVMRKISSYLISAAIAVMSLGCSRLEPESPEIASIEEEEEVLIHKSFLAETAETRTILDGVDVLFSKDESLSVWDEFENREFKADEAGRNVSFSGEVSPSATAFYALSPYSASTVFTKNGAAVTANTSLAAAQAATPGSFADGANISAAQSTSDDVFGLKNVLAVAKFTLASANLDGHQISSVELSGTYPLAGDVVVTYGETVSAAAGANTVNSVKLAKADGSALADGTYYLTLLPNAGGQITLKFTATDGYTASKTATLKSAFEAGTIKNLGTVKGLKWEGPKYVKVTAAPTDWTGDYLLVYEAKPWVLSGVANNIGSIGQVVIGDDQTISWEEYNNYNITVARSGNGYSLYLNGAGYLGARDENKLYASSSFPSSSPDAYRWSISIDDNGDVRITNLSFTGRAILCNHENTGQRFCAYRMSSLPDGHVKLVQLYKKSSGDESVSAPRVITNEATEITVSSAVLNATFADLGTDNVQDAHFLWGTSENNITNILGAEDFDVSTGTFHASLSSLAQNTTYYFKAVLQYCVDGVNYIPLSGETISFTTLSSSTGGDMGLQWLDCYEMPAVNLVNEASYSGTGQETFGSTYWYNYETTDNMQKVITHTYAYNGKVYRNYTTLVDGNKRCPLWTAYVMHDEAYPNLDAGRGSFNVNTSYDPGIPREWQSSGSTGDYQTLNYARGHMCASEDRQTTGDANWQTFYYTNQCPQKQDGFNSGVWSSLEGSVQSHAPTGRDTLYVVVGTLFEDGNTGNSNDGGIVARPSHFYKLLLKCSFNTSGTMTDAKGIAYLYTNEAHTGVTYYNSSFVTTIRAIEDRTGFNFFANVPADLQNTAEQTATALWTY